MRQVYVLDDAYRVLAADGRGTRSARRPEARFPWAEAWRRDRLVHVHDPELGNGIYFVVPADADAGFVAAEQDPGQWLLTLLAPAALTLPGAQVALVERSDAGTRLLLGALPAASGVAGPVSSQQFRLDQAIARSNWRLVISVSQSAAMAEARAALQVQRVITFLLLGALTSLVFAISWGRRRGGRSRARARKREVQPAARACERRHPVRGRTGRYPAEQHARGGVLRCRPRGADRTVPFGRDLEIRPVSPGEASRAAARPAG